MGKKGGENGYIWGGGGGGGEGTSTFIRSLISFIKSRLQSSTLQLIMAAAASSTSSFLGPTRNLLKPSPWMNSL